MSSKNDDLFITTARGYWITAIYDYCGDCTGFTENLKLSKEYPPVGNLHSDLESDALTNRPPQPLCRKLLIEQNSCIANISKHNILNQFCLLFQKMYVAEWFVEF